MKDKVEVQRSAQGFWTAKYERRKVRGKIVGKTTGQVYAEMPRMMTYLGM